MYVEHVSLDSPVSCMCTHRILTRKNIVVAVFVGINVQLSSLARQWLRAVCLQGIVLQIESLVNITVKLLHIGSKF